MIPDEIQYPDLHSAAKEAGIMSGDVILSVDSNKINDFNDLITSIGTNPDKDLIIEVLRDGRTLTFNVHSDLDKKTGAGKIGILADTTTLEKKEAKPEVSSDSCNVAGIKGNFRFNTYNN